MLKARTDEIASSVLDGEATLIHLTTRIYYALDGVGAEVWSVLLEGADRDRLIQAFAERYPGAPADGLRADLNRLVDELLEEGLIETADGEASPSPWPAAAPGPYVAPILQRFDDMQAQLALDPPLPMPPRGTAR